MGYTNLRPGENSAFYASLFHDVISGYDEPYWLWVRGSMALDYNGDGTSEEEAVIATIQQGDDRRPGPIEAAFLLICRVAANGERTTIARTLLFDRNPIGSAPVPANDLAIVRPTELTKVRAQLVEDKISLKQSLVVYFWGDETPGNVWYAGYGYNGGVLAKNLDVTLWQDTPGFLVVNLDRSKAASRFGYQLAFGISAIPPEVMAKIDEAPRPPLWGHVFARDESGMYRQADARFGDHYRQLETSWNQLYIKAMMQGLPAGDLAWFEYHLGLMNHYTGDRDMARRFLEKAGKNAVDESLLTGIHQAIAMVDGEDSTAWSSLSRPVDPAVAQN